MWGYGTPIVEKLDGEPFSQYFTLYELTPAEDEGGSHFTSIPWQWPGTRLMLVGEAGGVTSRSRTPVFPRFSGFTSDARSNFR
jgi:hypothetical protein